MAGKSFQYMLTVTIHGADVSSASAVGGGDGFCSCSGWLSTAASGKSFNSEPNRSRGFSGALVGSPEKEGAVLTVLLPLVGGVVDTGPEGRKCLVIITKQTKNI